MRGVRRSSRNIPCSSERYQHNSNHRTQQSCQRARLEPNTQQKIRIRKQSSKDGSFHSTLTWA